jgi:hypothetical protein
MGKATLFAHYAIYHHICSTRNRANRPEKWSIDIVDPGKKLDIDVVARSIVDAGSGETLGSFGFCHDESELKAYRIFTHTRIFQWSLRELRIANIDGSFFF